MKTSLACMFEIVPESPHSGHVKYVFNNILQCSILLLKHYTFDVCNSCRYYSIESVQVSDGGLYRCGVETSCRTVFSTNNISIIIAVNNTVDNSKVPVRVEMNFILNR